MPNRGWRPKRGEGGRHDTAPTPRLTRPWTLFLPKGPPTMLGKGHREAEAHRDKQRECTLRARSARVEGECRRRGQGRGVGIVGGPPTMHATPCATLVGKGNRVAVAQREKERQGALRARSAGGRENARGEGKAGAWGLWAVCAIGLFVGIVSPDDGFAVVLSHAPTHP